MNLLLTKFSSCARKLVFQKRTLAVTHSIVDMAYDIEEPTFNKDDKKGILVLHGLLGSKRNWRSISKNLAPHLGLKVYNLDARNHGDSPHTLEHSSEYIAEDVAEFISLRNLQSVYAIGHSMGGRAMMYFTLKYPHLVDRVIIVDVSPISIPRNLQKMSNIFETMKYAETLSSDISLSKGRNVIKSRLLLTLNEHETSTADFILMNLRKQTDTGEFYWTANVDVLQRSLQLFDNFSEHINQLPPYEGKILFLCGTKSDFFNYNDWPEIQKIFPNAELKWIEAGHLLHIEKPKDFINISTEFFS